MLYFFLGRYPVLINRRDIVLTIFYFRAKSFQNFTFPDNGCPNLGNRQPTGNICNPGRLINRSTGCQTDSDSGNNRIAGPGPMNVVNHDPKPGPADRFHVNVRHDHVAMDLRGGVIGPAGLKPIDANMIRVATAVREGAYAYLKRQYKIVAAVFAVLVLVLLVMARVLQLQPALTALGVPIAGLLSGVCGFFGMRIATNASGNGTRPNREATIKNPPP